MTEAIFGSGEAAPGAVLQDQRMMMSDRYLRPWPLRSPRRVRSEAAANSAERSATRRIAAAGLAVPDEPTTGCAPARLPRSCFHWAGRSTRVSVIVVEQHQAGTLTIEEKFAIPAVGRCVGRLEAPARPVSPGPPRPVSTRRRTSAADWDPILIWDLQEVLLAAAQRRTRGILEARIQDDRRSQRAAEVAFYRRRKAAPSSPTSPAEPPGCFAVPMISRVGWRRSARAATLDGGGPAGEVLLQVSPIRALSSFMAFSWQG